VINGVKDSICYVASNGKSFRVKSEEMASVVHEYDHRHIEEALTLTISVNSGRTWINIPFAQAMDEIIVKEEPPVSASKPASKPASNPRTKKQRAKR